MTEFHYLVLRGDLLQVVNQLSEEVAYEEPFRMTRMKGDPRALVYDPQHGQQWLYNDAEWSATWTEFRADGTATLVCVDESGNRLFHAEVDVDGGAELIEVYHPWHHQ